MKWLKKHGIDTVTRSGPRLMESFILIKFEFKLV